MTESTVFRLGYVPGVMPAKWVRAFAQRRPDAVVELVETPAAQAAELARSGAVDAVLARPASEGDPGLAAIRLYDEVPVVVVPKDHLLTAAEECTVADLAGEWFVSPADDVLLWPAARPGETLDFRPASTAEAVGLVADGHALLVVPMSLARLHHRRDLTYRPLADGPACPVALLWAEPTGELVEEFIGVVRGRRPGSSRGRGEPAPKRSAKEKAAARRAAKEAAGTVPPRKPKSRRGSRRQGR